MNKDQAVLKIAGLGVNAFDGMDHKRIVNSFNLIVEKEKIVALVGGSGSGKTTTGLAILRLLPEALMVHSGKIIFEGRDLLALSLEEMRQLRGAEIGMVFQEPLYAFNPVFRIGDQIKEVLIFHSSLGSEQRQKRILELLNLVGISEPQRIANSYPHQLSGGMRQRAMIAQAIAGDPKLIIADEPTSNLDVTLQAHIIELFRKLKDELRLSILLITHDLGMVEHLADEVAVLSGGRVIESGPTKEILQHPNSEYTKQLMAAFR